MRYLPIATPSQSADQPRPGVPAAMLERFDALSAEQALKVSNLRVFLAELRRHDVPYCALGVFPREPLEAQIRTLLVEVSAIEQQLDVLRGECPQLLEAA